MMRNYMLDLRGMNDLLAREPQPRAIFGFDSQAIDIFEIDGDDVDGLQR